MTLAEASGEPIDTVLTRETPIGADRLESLRREWVEQAVLDMFSWRSGEFSFEIREEVDPGDAGLRLRVGINTQYLAMEATRLRDEVDAVSAVEPEPPAAEPPRSLEAAESAEAVEPVDSVEQLVRAAVRTADPTAPPPPESPGEPAAPCDLRVVVAIDPDLGALEWVKAALEDAFARVHIFQRGESAIERIRHYLARSLVPLVLVSRRATAAAPELGPDVVRLVERLRALFPSMPILGLCPEGDAGPVEGTDGCVRRPPAPGSDPRGWEAHAEAAQQLRADLEPWTRRIRNGPSARLRRRSPGLERIKQVSDRLRDPKIHGEVLPQVLEFASQCFERVVIFMVRDDVAVGMAQLGLAGSGGPGDEELRRFQMAVSEMPAALRRVLQRREAVTWTPRGDDGCTAELAMRLGRTLPGRCYAAPIESGGRVVALLFADDLPSGAPFCDTTGLEIVLHQAGLALDRALLERALADSRNPSARQ